MLDKNYNKTSKTFYEIEKFKNIFDIKYLNKNDKQ